MTTVLKIGGELLEDAASVRALSAAIASLAAGDRLVIVHGGGRAIDAELRARQIEPRFVDGLRITDAPTLESVVSVLAGRTNTAFVAALNQAGVRGVGLTGADAGIGRADKAPVFVSARGEAVDLGLVGQPVETPVTLLRDLTALGYVPVVASIGVSADGTLLNVNADTLAGHLAASLGADRLIIAGGTTGVLDDGGRTIPALSPGDIDRMVASGQAHSGMVAKLTACRLALAAGVHDICIVTGRNITNFERPSGTRIVPADQRPTATAAGGETWSRQ